MPTFLADARRLSIVAFGFVPLLQLVVDPAELMTGGRLHLGLAELLKQAQRRLLSRQRLLQFPFRQREDAKTAQLHALRLPVLQFVGDLQGRFVGLFCLAVPAAGAERIAEIRAQRAPQTFHAIAGWQAADDVNRLPHALHGGNGPIPQLLTAAEPAEDHCAAVAWRFADANEKGLEDFGGLDHVPLVEQLLATFTLGDIPHVRVVIPTSHRSLFTRRTPCLFLAYASRSAID